jgi:hypothetical protein
MKKLTKKSLDELAKTMNIIPEDERENYWGMYNYDCYWRCVSWLCSGDSSEEGAASIARYYCENYNPSYFENNLSHNNAFATYAQMDDFGSEYQIPQNTIAGFDSDVLNKYYGSSGSPVPTGGHVVVNLGKDADNNYKMYDPQNNYSFVMSESDFAKATYSW